MRKNWIAALLCFALTTGAYGQAAAEENQTVQTTQDSQAAEETQTAQAGEEAQAAEESQPAEEAQASQAQPEYQGNPQAAAAHALGLSSVPNARDMGGYPAGEGLWVKR